MNLISTTVENELSILMDEMYNKEVFIIDFLIKEKGKRIRENLNRSLPLSQQIHLNFSNGRISKFKKRNNFKARKSHREPSDADGDGILNATPSLRAMLSMYTLNDVFNADEYGLFYTEAPNILIGPGPLKGKKKKKIVSLFWCVRM